MIEVYDKKFSTDGLNRICWIAAIPCLICTGIVLFTYSREEIGQSFILKALFAPPLVLLLLLGILETFRKGQLYGSIGETFYLSVKDDSISFRNTQIKISEIESVIIRITKNRIEDFFLGNNYLEIRTRSDKHQLGLLIGNDKKIELVVELVKKLKQSKVKVTYENYV